MKNVDPMEKLFKMLRVNNICSKLQIIFSKNKRAKQTMINLLKAFCKLKK